MLKDRPVWIKWYPYVWLSGETRLSMSLAERGAYRDLRDYCSINGSIPSEPKVLARLLGISTEDFNRVWTGVSSEFVPDGEDRLVNRRATEAKKEAERFMRKQRANGSRGGRTKKNPNETQPKPMGLPTSNPRQSHGVTNSKHKQTDKQTDRHTDRQLERVLPDLGVER